MSKKRFLSDNSCVLALIIVAIILLCDKKDFDFDRKCC